MITALYNPEHPYAVFVCYGNRSHIIASERTHEEAISTAQSVEKRAHDRAVMHKHARPTVVVMKRICAFKSEVAK